MGLLAEKMPKGSPNRTEMNTAVATSAIVLIPSVHRPRAPIRKRLIPVKMATLRPETSQPITNRIIIVIGQGTQVQQGGGPLREAYDSLRGVFEAARGAGLPVIID